MQPIKEIEKLCPNCKTSNYITAITVLHEGDIENFHDQLKRRQFFLKECRNCREPIYFKYDLLFHNPKKRFLIYLHHPNSETYLQTSNDSDLEIIKKIPSDYKSQIALNGDEFLETLVCLENNMDKRILELYKIFLKIEKNIPLKSTTETLYLTEIKRPWFKRTKLIFSFLDSGGMQHDLTECINITRFNKAKKLIQILDPTLLNNEWYLINWNYPLAEIFNINQGIELPTPIYIEMNLSGKKLILPNQFLTIAQRLGKADKI
jgi:hypothetical protein